MRIVLRSPQEEDELVDGFKSDFSLLCVQILAEGEGRDVDCLSGDMISSYSDDMVLLIIIL